MGTEITAYFSANCGGRGQGMAACQATGEAASHNLERRGRRSFPGGPGGGHLRRKLLVKDSEAGRSSLRKGGARASAAVPPVLHQAPLLCQQQPHSPSGTSLSAREALLRRTPPQPQRAANDPGLPWQGHRHHSGRLRDGK